MRKKARTLDDMMKMYDKRIKYFGEKGDVLARKANSWLKYNITSRNNPVEGEKLTDVFKKAYEWLNTSVSDLGNKSEPSTLLLFMRSSVALFKGGELPKETVVKNYDLTTRILNQVIKENKDAEAVRNAKIVQPYIEEVFGESGAADCEALVNIYTPQFEENKNNAEFIKTMLQKLRRAKCDNNELLEKASVRLYELEPSAEAAFNMAHSYLSKNDIANAKKFYKQAIDQETNTELLATYYYEYGLVLYSNDKNYQEAREMARKAISNDPTLCKAYILIGDIYVAASSTFSSDPFEKASVFWLAVDYYNKAKTYEDCSMDAAKKAADYKKYYPKSEDAFMNGIHEGDTYKVEGWINETTKARF